MLVVERRGDWVKVQVPVRPNGTDGWVDAADVDLSTTTYRIEINVSERMLRAYDGHRARSPRPRSWSAPRSPRRPPAASTSPTSSLRQSPAYGPVALATDGYSEMIDEFDTGVPVVAMHGTNRPELLGQARSNGCVRVPERGRSSSSPTRCRRGTPSTSGPDRTLRAGPVSRRPRSRQARQSATVALDDRCVRQSQHRLRARRRRSARRAV